MSIIETRIRSRSNVSVPFFHHTGDAVIASYEALKAPFLNAGNVTIVETVSSDQTESTIVTTFDSVSTYEAYQRSVVLNNLAIPMTIKTVTYNSQYQISALQNTLEGIDTELSMTLNFTVNESLGNATGVASTIGNWIVANNPSANTTVNGTTVICELPFHDAEEFSIIKPGVLGLLYSDLLIPNAYNDYVTFSSNVVVG